MIAFLGSQLPPPVEEDTLGDGSMCFTGGAPGEVVVLLTDSTVTVCEHAGAWESPDRFVPRPRRVGQINWRRLSETAVMNVLTALIKGARENRLARYRPCALCEAKTPPELLFADGVCHDCASLRPTTVH